MARDLSRVKARFFEGLRQIYRVSAIAADATEMEVQTLQSYITILTTEHNKARLAWNDFVALEGAETARNILAETVNSPPADITTQLTTMRDSIVALLDAFVANYGSGVTDNTFSYSLIDGLFQGGFTKVQLGAGALTTVTGMFTTIRDNVEVLAPVS